MARPSNVRNRFLFQPQGFSLIYNKQKNFSSTREEISSFNLKGFHQSPTCSIKIQRVTSFANLENETSTLNSERNNTNHKTVASKSDCEGGTASLTDKKLSSEDQRANSTKSCPRNNQLSCDICHKRFKQTNYLTLHRRRVHATDYLCQICQKSFSSAVRLRDHKLLHERRKAFKCKFCSRMFITNYILKEHIRKHTGDRPHVCDICGKGFMRKRNLTMHKKRHFGDKRFLCDICDRKFYSNCELDKHKIKHADKPYQCELCPAQFALKASLMIHIMMWSGGKPYRCVACDARFLFKSSFTRHIDVHLGLENKLHECDVCKKIFTTNAGRRNHMLIHAYQRPFKCMLCQCDCTTRAALNEHMWQHTGIKSYSCNFCDKKFASSSYRSKHEKLNCPKSPYRKAESRPFKCDKCTSTFVSETNLKIHVTIVHTIGGSQNSSNVPQSSMRKF